jgi:hypothetical protein
MDGNGLCTDGPGTLVPYDSGGSRGKQIITLRTGRSAILLLLPTVMMFVCLKESHKKIKFECFIRPFYGTHKFHLTSKWLQCSTAEEFLKI